MKIGRLLRKVGPAAVLLAATAVPAAHADTTTLIDRADSDSPLDIAAVEHGHQGRGALTFEVVTYEPWDGTLEGSPHFLFRINTDSDRRPERFIVIRPAGDGARATVLDNRGESEGVLGHPEATRPDDHSVRIVVDRDLLKKRRLRSLSWQLHSDVETRQPPCDGESGGCTDYAPSKRYVEHDV